MKRILVAASVLPALLTLAACGGEDESPASPTGTPAGQESTPPAASSAPKPDASKALKAAVKAYSDAFLTGKSSEAFALLSERCKKHVGETTFTGAVELAASIYGKALPFTSYTADISGTMARVTYTYSDASINQDAEPWVNESGWKQDDC